MGKSGAIAVSLTRFMCLHETEEHIIDEAELEEGAVTATEKWTETFDKYMREANVIITHAGVGTIIQGLKLGKKMIVAANRYLYRREWIYHS